MTLTVDLSTMKTILQDYSSFQGNMHFKYYMRIWSGNKVYKTTPYTQTYKNTQCFKQMCQIPMANIAAENILHKSIHCSVQTGKHEL